MYGSESQQPKWYLLPLTGSSPSDLQQKSITLRRYIQQYPTTSLHQIAASLGQEVTRNGFRQAVVANSSAQLDEQLTKNELQPAAFDAVTQKLPVIFMFPGIGDHYVQMGRGLYTHIAYFREILQECDAGLRPFLNESLIDLLYPAAPSSQSHNNSSPGLDLAVMLGRKDVPNSNTPLEARLQETIIAHPLVFSLEYALARLLQYWGLEPQGLIGYSLGEYVSATIAGVLTLEDALMLVARRAQLIQALPEGKMLATPLSREAVAPYLNKNVSLSAHNGEALTVLAGEAEAILVVRQKLLERQIACRLLDTSHAFHSHMMQTAVAEVNDLARSIIYAAPQIPYLSNVTGTWITARQATDPTYWSQHMCQPVQYFTMLYNLLNQAQTYHLIEVGPGQSLSAFAKQHPQCEQAQYPFILPTLPYSYDHQDDHWFLLSTIRKLWLSGAALQWQTILSGDSGMPPEAADYLLPFTLPDHNAEQAEQQKDRGQKRRQNQLRRRHHGKEA